MNESNLTAMMKPTADNLYDNHHIYRGASFVVPRCLRKIPHPPTLTISMMPPTAVSIVVRIHLIIVEYAVILTFRTLSGKVLLG